jgi:flagellar biosynthesis protein FlhG
VSKTDPGSQEGVLIPTPEESRALQRLRIDLVGDSGGNGKVNGVVGQHEGERDGHTEHEQQPAEKLRVVLPPADGLGGTNTPEMGGRGERYEHAPVSMPVPMPVSMPMPSAYESSASSRGVPILAVTSGKGGVGKTSLSVNLAIALTQRRQRVTLMDADLGLANADVLCGLSPTTRLDSVVASGSSKRSLRQIAVQAPGGFRLVPGSVGVARMADLPESMRQELLDGLAELEQDSDLVMIDTGAGLSEGVTSFVRNADLAMVVVTPEPTSIADSYAIIKLVRTTPVAEGQHPPRIAIAVNNAVDENEAHQVRAKIAGTCRKFLGFEPRMLGWVRRDELVPNAVKARTPLLLGAPESGVASDIRNLAESIARELSLRVPAVQPVQQARKGWWSRIFGG